MLAECLASLMAMAPVDKRASACLEWVLDMPQRCSDSRRSGLSSDWAMERRIDEELWDEEWL
jgi:hypothetical protein